MARKKKRLQGLHSQELAFTGTITTFLSNLLNFCLSAAGHADLVLPEFHFTDIMTFWGH
jgi:hypothetical protein